MNKIFITSNNAKYNNILHYTTNLDKDAYSAFSNWYLYNT